MAKQTELKYYKGEKSNPFEEINEKQGLHAMRYNQLASLLWYFEYYWEHGRKGLQKLENVPTHVFFGGIPEPQKQFSSFEDALVAFASSQYTGWLNGRMHWVLYVYEHAQEERFYQPQCQIVLKEELPKYLLYWDGSTFCRWKLQSTTKGTARSFWWDFESSWYRNTPRKKRTEAGWRQYLREYLMWNSNHHPKSEEYKNELTELLERYKSWLK